MVIQNLDEKKIRASLHLQQHMEANRVKDKLLKKGYFYSISFYGIMYNPETEKKEYRRIEVFLDNLPTQYDVGALKLFFEEFIPYQYYTIWVYNTKHQEIILYKGWQ